MQEQFSQATGMVSQRILIEKLYEMDIPVQVNPRGIAYLNIPAAFDIETSSFYVDDKKVGTMYCWQFGIGNLVTIGRTWDEFKKFLRVLSTTLGLSENFRLVIYVHNLPYEFQFMRKQISWDKVFFLDERKPVYAITGGIEFRCSLKLSSKSLENVGKDLVKYKVKKLVGDLDYSLIRTTKTPLTEKELGYCENDIRVILAYIQEKIEADGGIAKIPLTNTGYVRNYCREACFANYRHYRAIMDELTLDAEEYSQLKRAFAGGFTHAHAKYVGKKIPNVESQDFTSSYPYVMCANKFPMSKSSIVNFIDGETNLDYYLENYCCLFDITFYDLCAEIHHDHPLSASKCSRLVGEVVDNGRLMAASIATTTITEQDYMIFKAFYSWDRCEIHSMRIYKKGYLPTEFVKAILELYRRKTVLKDVEGEEVNYMISKGMLNSAYGMAVTDIVRDIIDYEDDTFKSTKPNLEDAIEKYNKNGNRFLFYPWGVWVTAYARANLFTGILSVGSDYIYADTDSIKYRNPDSHSDYFVAYNENVKQKLRAAAEFHGIDPQDFSPRNKYGEEKMLGVWEDEGSYRYFKTLGAKRYMTLKGDKYSITVAGLHKQKAKEYILANWKDPFSALKDELKIPPESSGRLTLTYIDEPIEGSIVDYTGVEGEYSELSCIHMEPSEYELTIHKDYKKFLDYLMRRTDISW